MTDEIDPQAFEHLVRLAALQLAPEEAEYLRRELNRQLRVIAELEAIPLDPSVPPTSHGVPGAEPTRTSMREDAWEPCGNTEEILSQAPSLDQGCFVVPDIPHTDLEQ